MRSRIVTIAAALLATATVAGVSALALFGGSGEEIPTAVTTLATTTTLPPPSSTTLPTSTTTTPLAPTTTTTTTTTTPPRVAIETVDGSSPALIRSVTDLYSWMADPSARRRFPLPEGMGSHLEPGRTDTTIETAAMVNKDELADGTRVAVVLIGDDVILAVAGRSRWEIVGAKLTSFGLDAWYGNPTRHVLVVGTDARPHQSQPDFRADSIHIIGASLETAGGGIVGFPRDTYVAASYGQDKYSSVNVRGSTLEMVEIAEDLSGIDLEGYILTGFAGFKHLVNAFGGVELEVPFRMSDDASNAFLDAGLQVLKGGDALAFSRNRHINGGDFARSRHQGVVIAAGLTGVQALGIETLPKLLRLLTADTWTDLDAAQLLQLGAIAFELDPNTVGNVVLPGSVGTANGSSVVRLTSGANAVFQDLADGTVGD